MSEMVLFMVAYIRGRQCPQGVYSVHEEWSVMAVTNYIRDGLFVRDELCFFGFTLTHSLIHSKQIRDFYMDRSDVIRIVTLKNNINSTLYICRTFAKTAHTNHETRWSTRRIYSLLNILSLIWGNVVTQ